MATIENMQQAQNLAGDTYKQIAGQKAAQFAQNGDYQSAYSTMIQADPANADRYISQAAQINPDLGQKLAQAHQTGELTAQSGFGSTPGQIQTSRNEGEANVANIRGQYEVAAQKARYKALASKPQLRTNPYDQMLHSYVIDPDTGREIDQGAVSGPAGQPSQSTGSQSPQPTAQVADASKRGLGAQPLSDSQQNPSSQANPFGPIKPTGNLRFDKEIGKGIDSLNKDPDMKDMNTEINGLDQVGSLLKGNLPGSEQPIVMKFLTSSEFVKRFNEAEYAYAPDKAQGYLNKINNWISQGAKGQLDPTVAKNFQDIVYLMQHSALKQYEGSLHSKAGGIYSKLGGGMGADEAFARLVPGSNPIFQKGLKTYMGLSDKDRAQVDWAREHLGEPYTLDILRANGL